VDALDRAYAGYERSGSGVEAAKVALLLAYLASRRLAMSVAGGWKANAVRLLEGEPEGPVHAYLSILDMFAAITGGELKQGLAIADDVIETARRTGNREAESLAKAFKGYGLIASGEWMDGLALIDEATAVALAGGAGLRSASDVYCVTIAACRNFADFGRAGEWTEKADRWMSQHSLGGYSGVCRVHRAELKRLHGEWDAAELEALDACAELERYQMFDGVGLAHYEIGEVRLNMGDFDGAEAAPGTRKSRRSGESPGAKSFTRGVAGQPADEDARPPRAGRGRPDQERHRHCPSCHRGVGTHRRRFRATCLQGHGCHRSGTVGTPRR
jgi:hypothetical protein